MANHSFAVESVWAVATNTVSRLGLNRLSGMNPRSSGLMVWHEHAAGIYYLRGRMRISA